MAGPTYSRVGGTPPAEGYLEQLIASINDSARTARTSMTTLLVVIVYLGAACLAADHEALLRGGATSIPQVGVRLPLVASFALAPPVLLFLHVALLVQLDLLAQKIRRFRDEIERIQNESQRRAYRLLIFPFAFAQTHLEGWRIGHQPMIVLSWLAVVALPFAVLLIVLLRFLPYQDAPLTFSHQLWVVLDSLTLWFFQLRRHPYPATAGRRDRFDLRARQHGHIAYRWVFLLGLVCALTYGVFDQARIPVAGEGDVRRDIDARDVPGDPAAAKDVANLLDWACAEYDFPCRYIKLTDRTLVQREAPRALVTKYDDDAKKLNAALKRHADGLFLRGRSLRYADLQRANLFRADLIGADLFGARLDQAGLAYAVIRGATLESAWLRGARLTRTTLAQTRLNKAKLGCIAVKIPNPQSGSARSGLYDCTDLQGADLRAAHLQGADLRGAYLKEVNLVGARLQGADLRYAHLQSSDLRARLQGADLRYVKLQGAILTGAYLQGANLGRAYLDGADLRNAHLQAADLRRARVQSADLRNAYFQGADLRGARLEGADLRAARLQGADLRGAYLQGADLRATHLQGADFLGAELQGATFRYAYFQGADLHAARLQGADLRGLRFDSLLAGDFDAIRTVLESAIKDADRRERVLARLDRGRKAGPAGYPSGMYQSAAATEIFDRDALFKNWKPPVHGGNPKRYFALLVPQLTKLACSAPETAPGIVRRAFGVPGLARALLEAPCVGKLKLSDRVVDSLKRERARQAAKESQKRK